MSAQSLEALSAANRARSLRSQLKRDVAAGNLTVAEVLVDPPPYTLRMPLFDLLAAQPRWGAKRTRRLLTLLQISELRLIGELTYRQRDLIVGMV